MFRGDRPLSVCCRWRVCRFASLLTAEGKILVSANNNRTGEVWDVAGGLAARVSSGAATQIRSTDLISYTVSGPQTSSATQ